MSIQAASPEDAIIRVLKKRRGGVDRSVLVECAANVARTTLDEAEDALEYQRERGEVWDVDGAIELTPNRRPERNWGGFS